MQNPTAWPILSWITRRVHPLSAPANSEFPMTHVTYKIVEHDGGWAYTVNGAFSEPFPNRAASPDAVSVIPHHSPLPSG